MAKIKNMSQEEFDKYIMLYLLPDISDEYAIPTAIILFDNHLFQFAKECKNCHDYILLGEKYEIPDVILDVQDSDLKNYLSFLTELDVLQNTEIEECECDSDEIDFEDYYEESNDEEFYDDYYE